MVESKELSLQESLFLDFLFDGAEVRHPDLAKQMAGYPKDFPVAKILKNINKELIERCDNYLALHAPNGVIGLIQLLNEPETPGSKLKLQTIIELLDRAGVVKKEKSEVTQASPNFMFVLPSKTQINELKE